MDVETETAMTRKLKQRLCVEHGERTVPVTDCLECLREVLDAGIAALVGEEG